MITSKLIFVNCVAVRRIVIDTNAKEATFLQTIKPHKLPMSNLQNNDELRNAVIPAYQNTDQVAAP